MALHEEHDFDLASPLWLAWMASLQWSDLQLITILPQDVRQTPTWNCPLIPLQHDDENDNMQERTHACPCRHFRPAGP